MLQRERVLEALSALGRAPSAPREGLTASSPPDPGEASPLPGILGGGWIETEMGRAFVKDVTLPVDHRHGSMPIQALLDTPQESLAAAFSHSDPPPAGRLGFFDTETTGLSGGTGTVIFLAGLGWFEDGAFRLRQYFLPTLEDERAMLGLLARDLGRCEGVVTYNGRAFDMPLLETRLTITRLRELRPTLPHFDILRAVRRLYRHRFESCRLAEAESRLLGFVRENDVAGSVIPSLYFDFIRAGRVAPLRAVFRHNALDILSLAGVLGAIAALFGRTDLEPPDAAALARWWELERRPDRAEGLYRRAMTHLEGEPLSPAWTSTASRFAMLLKRNGEREQAAALWRQLWSRGDLQAGLELAKHLEHTARDRAAARVVALGLLESWPRADAAGIALLEHRLKRLERTSPRRAGPHEN